MPNQEMLARVLDETNLQGGDPACSMLQGSASVLTRTSFYGLTLTCHEATSHVRWFDASSTPESRSHLHRRRFSSIMGTSVPAAVHTIRRATSR